MVGGGPPGSSSGVVRALPNSAIVPVRLSSRVSRISWKSGWTSQPTSPQWVYDIVDETHLREQEGILQMAPTMLQDLIKFKMLMQELPLTIQVRLGLCLPGKVDRV